MRTTSVSFHPILTVSERCIDRSAKLAVGEMDEIAEKEGQTEISESDLVYMSRFRPT